MGRPHSSQKQHLLGNIGDFLKVAASQDVGGWKQLKTVIVAFYRGDLCWMQVDNDYYCHITMFLSFVCMRRNSCFYETATGEKHEFFYQK